MNVNRKIRRFSILEEAAPEKIEREATAGEEKERDLRSAGEASAVAGNSRSRYDQRRRRRGNEVGLRVEPEQGPYAKRDGEDDHQLPAQPDDVARRDRR